MQCRRWLFTTKFIFVILALFLLGDSTSYNVIISRVWRNIGMLQFQYALSDNDSAKTTLSNAINALKYSETWSTSFAGQRALGHMLLANGQAQKALEIWQKIPQIYDEMVIWGNQSRDKADYLDASVWYARAGMIDSTRGDHLYEEGIAYQQQKKWAEALSGLKAALDFHISEYIGTSQILFTMGNIYRLAFQNAEQAAQLYTDAIAQNNFTTARAQSQAYYRRGEMLEWLDYPPTELIPDFRQAIALNPKHRWAHLRLGSALYKVYGDPEMAEKEFRQALSLWPNDPHRKYPYLYLASLYEDIGNYKQAIIEYKNVLRVDAENMAAQAALQRLLSDNSN